MILSYFDYHGIHSVYRILSEDGDIRNLFIKVSKNCIIQEKVGVSKIIDYGCVSGVSPYILMSSSTFLSEFIKYIM